MKILPLALAAILISSTVTAFTPNSSSSHQYRRRIIVTSTPHHKMISNVVIAIAMEAEASPFVTHLALQPDKSFFPSQTPFHAFSGKYGSCNLTVITNGKDVVYDTGVDNVGTVPAAVATFLTWVNDIIHLYTHTSVVLLMTMLSALHHPLL